MFFANPIAVEVRRVTACFIAVIATCCFVQKTNAQAPTKDGLILSVPNPITDVYVQQVKQKVEAAEKSGRNLKVVAFDFNPTGHASGTSNFGSCHDLASYILDLSNRVLTVAYISNETTQHTVLPALACSELWMSEATDEKSRLVKAKIGDIRRGQDHLKANVIEFYRMVAKKRGLGDLVERMIDKDVPLKKVKMAEGTLYLQSTAQLPEKSYTLEELPPDLTPGKSLFDAHLARQLFLCKRLCSSREALARDLELPRKALSEDWLFGRTPVVRFIEFKSETNKSSMESLQRRIKRAMSQRANFIILQLEGSGGDLTDVASTAEFISDLKDETGNPIKTVAYIPAGTSLGAATFLALSCSEIVMGENTVLADFSYLTNLQEPELKLRRDMLVPLAKKQGYPWRLFEASLDPNLDLYWVQPKAAAKESGMQIVTRAELEQDAKEKKKWSKVSQITDGQMLKINAELARNSGTAQILNGTSVESLYALYGIDSSKVRVARDDWLDRVAEFFRDPLVGFLLVMLGIIGLILELKMPGTAVPGVMAAICFVLFFWSYSFVGEFTMLAVLLFILGIVLLGVEIFVLPGFGFTGITGILLVICSLALVTLEKWPSSSEEWMGLGSTLVSFGMSLTVAVVAAMIVAWFLPSIPYVNRLVLNPPEEMPEPFETSAPVSLLGAIGLASTPLRPAGKAQFGDDFHDVIAEGDFVNAGQRVQIIEIEGNRIVVKEI